MIVYVAIIQARSEIAAPLYLPSALSGRPDMQPERTELGMSSQRENHESRRMPSPVHAIQIAYGAVAYGVSQVWQQAS
jgi:hypothetical protein